MRADNLEPGWAQPRRAGRRQGSRKPGQPKTVLIDPLRTYRRSVPPTRRSELTHQGGVTGSGQVIPATTRDQRYEAGVGSLAGTGVYAWWFREIPPGLDTGKCLTHDDLTLLYVGISPKRPPKEGQSSRQTLRTRIRYHYRGKRGGIHAPAHIGVPAGRAVRYHPVPDGERKTDDLLRGRGSPVGLDG